MKTVRPNGSGFFPRVVEAPFYGDVALANMSQFRVAAWMVTGKRIFIGVEGHGSYSFSGYAHWGYVKEKLGLRHDGDARNMADFIHDQLDEGVLRQGEYQISLCREWQHGD